MAKYRRKCTFADVLSTRKSRRKSGRFGKSTLYSVTVSKGGTGLPFQQQLEFKTWELQKATQIVTDQRRVTTSRAVKFSAKLMSQAMAKRVKTTILYASETGNSQAYAKNLCEIFMHDFDAKVMSMDEFDVVQLEQETLVLVVTSTSGNGGPPQNGEKLHAALMEMRHPTTNMEDIKFSVFGLGSRAYPHFCAFAHAMDTLFEELGGERILQMGEGDELCGQAESFRTWDKKVFKAACNIFCVGDEGKIEKANKFSALELTQALYIIHKTTFYGAKLLTRKSLQSHNPNRITFLVQFHTNNHKELKYQSGDEVCIFPGNHKESVISLIDKLEDAPSANQIVTRKFLERKNRRNRALGMIGNWTEEKQIPPCTIYQAFKYFLNINTPPSPLLLQQFASLASNDEQKKRLEVLSKGLQEYEEWKLYNNPTMLWILEEFPSLQIPSTLLLTLLPLLQPRFYCISSSPDSCPGEIHVTVVILTYPTRDGDGPLRYGVCSSWLNSIKRGETVPCFIRRVPTYYMPKDPTLPCILVGPGTGLAPFRCFWQQRLYDLKYKGIESCPMILVIGCQQSGIDHMYKEETIKAKNQGVFEELYMAYSQEPGETKKYVMDVLREQLSDKVYGCLKERGGHVYVCGDKSMSGNILKTIQQIIMLQGNMSLEDAGSFISKLRNENRYHERVLSFRDSDGTFCR